jgi:ABC-type phosphate transport system substrate-binding protein
MCKKTISKSLLAVLICSTVSMVSHADLVVVVHPTNDATLDLKMTKRIFLGKEKRFSNGKEILPINQERGSGTRDMFDNEALGRNTSQVSAYWSKLVFTGKGVPPAEVSDDLAVIEIVANNKNAVGYVNSASVTGAVKVISLQ